MHDFAELTSIQLRRSPSTFQVVRSDLAIARYQWIAQAGRNASEQARRVDHLLSFVASCFTRSAACFTPGIVSVQPLFLSPVIKLPLFLMVVEWLLGS